MAATTQVRLRVKTCYARTWAKSSPQGSHLQPRADKNARVQEQCHAVVCGASQHPCVWRSGGASACEEASTSRWQQQRLALPVEGMCGQSASCPESLSSSGYRMSRPGSTPGGHGILVCRGLKGIESGSSLLSSFLFPLPLAHPSSEESSYMGH